MVSERNEVKEGRREGRADREEAQGLKYTSSSPTRYEILDPLSVVGLATLGLSTTETKPNREKTIEKRRKTLSPTRHHSVESWCVPSTLW